MNIEDKVTSTADEAAKLGEFIIAGLNMRSQMQKFDDPAATVMACADVILATIQCHHVTSPQDALEQAIGYLRSAQAQLLEVMAA